MRKLLPLFTLFFLLNTSFAVTISVSSASDIANANPQPGDILLMDKNANWANQDITFDGNGTSENPITLKAEGDGEVVLSGASRLIIAGSYLIVDGLSFVGCIPPGGADLVSFRTSSSNVATDCRLTNCFFDNNNPSNIETGYKWVSLYGARNRVDHCWFQRKEHRGTTLVVWLSVDDDPNYHQVDHNYFTRPDYTSGNNEAETIRIGDSKTSLVNSNTIVEHNYFEACDGEIESISNKSCYNIYRYNTFFNNSSILTLRHGHYCTVESNYFFGNNKSGSGGVRIIGKGHQVLNNYFQDIAGTGNLRAPIVMMGGVDGFDEFDATNRYVASQEALVAFNTLVNCTQNIYIGSDKASSSETYDAPFDCTIDNNIVYGGDRDVVSYEYNEIPSFDFSGNLYFNTELGPSNAGFTEIDPQLSTPETETPARLTSNSPAINAATGSYSLSEDFDGQGRSGVLDVGCDEFSTAPATRSPITKTSVGPCWMNPDACTPEVKIDCNGDENGTAFRDDCGECVEGNTGKTENTSCEQDCAGEWGGSASEDDCGVCSGGNTGITPNLCLECDEVNASSDDGNVPANVLDNDPTTRWSAQGAGAFIEFCFGDTLLLHEIDISFYRGDVRSTSFDLQVSINGQDWNTVLSDATSSGISTDLETFSFSQIPAWKLRIVGKGNSENDWNSITEVAWTEVILANAPEPKALVEIYPNPVENILHVSTTSSIQTIRLTSTDGQTIHIEEKREDKHAEINTENLPGGVYFLEVTTWSEERLHTTFIKP